MALRDLLGGSQEQSDYSDFVQRYDRGAPRDGFDRQEAYDRHEQVARAASSEEYEDSARRAFEQLSPEERREFGHYLRERSRERGYDVSPNGDGGGDEDPDVLAGLVGQLHRQQPDLVGQLFGQLLGHGGGVNALGGLLGGGAGGGGFAKAALGGIAAMAARKVLSR